MVEWVWSFVIGDVESQQTDDEMESRTNEIGFGSLGWLTRMKRQYCVYIILNIMHILRLKSFMNMLEYV